MATTDLPFALPATLSPPLQRVFSYWESLKRAENSMPFWDDVKLSALPDLADRLLLVNVFADPERFRINTIGRDFDGGQSETLRGKFIDEVELHESLSYLRAQCSATVEGRAPTYYSRHGTPGMPGFARILLPMWGDGRIGMLLGALELR